MTDKELRKLRRVELLELLVDQAAEMEDLRRQLEEAREALAERELHIKESGSMAEAALRLNGVFEAADQAAQQYLRSIEALKEQGILVRNFGSFLRITAGLPEQNLKIVSVLQKTI